MNLSFVVGKGSIARECFAASGKIAANNFPLMFGLDMILQIFVAEKNGAERTRLRTTEESSDSIAGDVHHKEHLFLAIFGVLSTRH